MPSPEGARPLTLVISGSEAELEGWRAILRGRPAEVRQASSAAASEGTAWAAEFVVATISADDARHAVDAAVDGGGGLVILAREGGSPHPFTMLVKAIASAKREWERALDAVLDAVVILDVAGRVLRANRAFAELCRRPFAEMLGRPYTELLGAPVAGTNDPIREVIEGAASGSGDARYTSIAGFLQVNATAWQAEGEAARTLVVSLRDVTALHEQQQRLELSHRLADVGRLAAGVAHEINTPLASIALRAESLLRRVHEESLRSVPAFEPFPRYLETIEQEAFRCKRIIGSLLDFARPRQPAIAPAQVNAIVETAVALVGDQARVKRVALLTQTDASLPLVPLDGTQVREALVALLLNALDASSAGGEVSVETSRDGADHLRIAVRDQGEGIAPENLDKVFVPFFTTRLPGQGVGLGLSICDGIVRGHGGEMTIESSQGVGTLVTVRLPLRRRVAAGHADRA